MRGVVLIVLIALALTACGGSTDAGVTYDPVASRAALTKAGWEVNEAGGMNPIAGGKQLGWLDAVSPFGVKVSLQFLESTAKATDELATIHKGAPGFKADAAFAGTTIGSVLVFATGSADEALPANAVESLGGLLTS